MKCTKCGEELNEKWAVCPFCGTEVPKTPKTIDEFLKEFVDEYGPSIFKEENNNRLDRYMGDWPEMYADDRDVIKLLQIKNIPDRLSSALDMPSEEQGAIVQESANVLCDKFGINGDSAAKMISLITDAIGLKTDVVVGDGKGTFKDPRDGQVYKTCKIGDQVWLAENLKYDVGEGCCVYENDYKYLDKYGYMYSLNALAKAVPEGWHLPSIEEVTSMEKFIIKEKRCKSAIPHLKSNKWTNMGDEDVDDSMKEFYKDINVDVEEGRGLDTYGFSALPGGYRCGFLIPFSSRGENTKWWLKWTNQKNKNHFYETGWEIDRSSTYISFDRWDNRSAVEGLYFYVRLIKD